MSGPSQQPPRMSSQMQAVMRVLTGQEERTIAQKLADSNRPTWEQYKKDNEDKLNIEGVDQQKMEEYRQQLDAERDKILARGTNHSRHNEKKKSSKSKKKRKSSDASRRHDDSDSDSDSSTSSEDHHKRKRKHKKKGKKRHKRRHRRDDDHSDSDKSDSESEERKRRRKRSKKVKKKSSSGDGNDSDGSHYRLSKFFQGSDAST